MPRLFTAIEIPAGVASAIGLLRGGLPGARWIDPENYHLTLRFIGDTDNRVAADLVDELGGIDRPSFPLAFDGITAFGSRQPHAVVVRATRTPALDELYAAQERVCRRLGLPAETRKFAPHVTLARLRGVSAAEVAAYLSLRAAFTIAPFPVERFVLFSSRDGVGGGPYVLEEVFPLGDRR